MCRSGKVLYTVSHAHNCEQIGGFFQSDPWSINMRHALAFSTFKTGENAGVDDYGWDYTGVGASSLLHWYPALAIGSSTGQNQAAWSSAGNDQYLALAGEFPKVNGIAQQGLVRFATRDIAPNKRGPVRAPNAPTPTADSLSAGTARVGWQAPYDMDNEVLTYTVTRSGTAAPVYTTTAKSNFWKYPSMGFVDTGLTPGASYTYTIKVTDPTGGAISLPKTNEVTISTTAASKYSKAVVADGATDYWRLGEPSGTAVLDHAGFNDATAQAGVTRGATGAIVSDSNRASTFNGTSTGVVAQNSKQATTPSFSAEAWVKTTTKRGGKIVGYGGKQSGNSGNYDRHVYMDNAGRIIFGVYTGSARTVSSSQSFNNGAWHHVVATLSDTAGMTLYVDGKKVAGDTATKSAQDYSGYWRIGGDNLNGWSNRPSSDYFAGAIDDVAIYPTALSATTVGAHQAAGVAVVTNQAPDAAFTSSVDKRTGTFDATGSTDDGTITSYEWNFGDGQTATTASAHHDACLCVSG